ncbi:hypothetical protein [Bradyrhizobium algeriense]|nr:hypothetical protein [Bradyrhizobium algeriense]
MPDRFRIALAVTALALATVSAVDSASAGILNWSWFAVPLYGIPY